VESLRDTDRGHRNMDFQVKGSAMGRLTDWRMGLLLVCVAFFSADAHAACRVLDPELQGSYVGHCVNGLAEGMGIAKGSAEYVGEFKGGRKHGWGVKVWPSGDRYVGQFVDDAKQGMGLYVHGPGSPWAGDSYSGEWVADRRNGRGVYQWASGERYEGTWDNDRMTGPPTPMAIQRGRHQRAVERYVKKPGIKVCREVSVGIG